MSNARSNVWILRPQVNVTDPKFGAKGDGVTDDSAAIQAAQDYIETIAGATYNAAGLYFPSPRAADKFYLVNTPIKVNKVSKWHGDSASGSLLKTTANGGTILQVKKTIAPLSDPIQHFVCEDMMFRGNGAGSTAPIVLLENAQACQFERVDFFGGDVGVKLQGGTGGGTQSSFTNTFRNCRMVACNTAGVDADDGTQVLVLDGCTIGSSPYGVRHKNSSGLRVLNCDLEENTTAAIALDEVAYPIALNYGALIDGCHFEGNIGRDILLGSTNVVNTVNVIGNTFGSAAATKPIDAVRAANLNVIGNIAYAWTGTSLITFGTVTGWTELGNMVNVAGGAAHSAGIILPNTIGYQQLQPKQSAFVARPTAQAANVTGDATAYTVAWGTEILDQLNDFVTPNFTARNSGLHHFSIQLQATSVGAAHTVVIVNLVTTTRTYELFRGNPGAIRDAGNILTVAGAMAAYMNAGDTASIQFYVSGSTKTINVESNSTFSGYLVG